jgi:hypothetical protein
MELGFAKRQQQQTVLLVNPQNDLIRIRLNFIDGNGQVTVQAFEFIDFIHGILWIKF